MRSRAIAGPVHTQACKTLPCPSGLQEGSATCQDNSGRHVSAPSPCRSRGPPPMVCLLPAQPPSLGRTPLECEGSWGTLKVPVAMTMESVECYFGDGLWHPLPARRSLCTWPLPVTPLGKQRWGLSGSPV